MGDESKRSLLDVFKRRGKKQKQSDKLAEESMVKGESAEVVGQKEKKGLKGRGLFGLRRRKQLRDLKNAAIAEEFVKSPEEPQEKSRKSGSAQKKDDDTQQIIADLSLHSPEYPSGSGAEEKPYETDELYSENVDSEASSLSDQQLYETSHLHPEGGSTSGPGNSEQRSIRKPAVPKVMSPERKPDPEVVARFQENLRKRQDLRKEEVINNTILHIQVEKGNLEEVKKCLMGWQVGGRNIEPIDPNLQNSLGQTALHIAVEKGDLKIVNALMKAKADPQIKDKLGETPIDKFLKMESQKPDFTGEINSPILDALLQTPKEPMTKIQKLKAEGRLPPLPKAMLQKKQPTEQNVEPETPQPSSAPNTPKSPRQK
jgi:hypothetical protein